MVRTDRPAPGRGRRSAPAIRPRAVPGATASPWRRVAIALTGGIAVGLVASIAATFPVAATVAASALAVAFAVAGAAREGHSGRRCARARRVDGIAKAYDRATCDPWVTVGDDEVNVETGEVRLSAESIARRWRDAQASSAGGQSNEALLALTRAVDMALARTSDGSGGADVPPPSRPQPPHPPRYEVGWR